MEIHTAIKEHGWKVYQFNFTNGTKERIASFIHTDPTVPALTFHLKSTVVKQLIADEAPSFSYEKYFKRRLTGPIVDVTKKYITN